VFVELAIVKAEFEKGKPVKALGTQILEFLAKNDGAAYLEDDITANIMRAGDGEPILQALTIVGRQAVVLAVLDGLVREGKVVARIPGKLPYYMLVSGTSE
jgi:hypothetical protein